MKLKIREELLHYLWQVRAFDLNQLKTESGEEIEILSWGNLNQDAGPDFLNGKIKIGETVWAGHIEMHLSASDWRKHNHTSDPQYQNVVLHVVYHADVEIKRANGSIIPCLSLESRIHPSLLKTHEGLMNNRKWIPCQEHIAEVPEIHINGTIEKMLASRLDQKAIQLGKDLEELKGDVSTLILHQLAWSIGLRVNGQTMKLLMQSIPAAAIQKHRNQLLQIEALLFGQSGLLPADQDEYIDSLRREYQFLQTKFSLSPIATSHWKFHRLRSAAFPTIRIAQFAKLLHSVERLDALLLEGTIEEIQEALKVKAEGYWKYHYTWHTPSTPRAKSIGKSKREVLLINTVVPVLWFYGSHRGIASMKDKALSILETLPAERNSIINRWKELEVQSRSAFDSQGLLHLKKHYCNSFKCLECPIGHHVMSKAI